VGGDLAGGLAGKWGALFGAYSGVPEDESRG